MSSTTRPMRAVSPKLGGAANVATFRPDIQGLRAVAVIAVILDHFLGWPSGGFIGVDVFFVISGFLITALLLREHAKSGTISFTGFYLRRAKRIMPAALVVVVATLAASFALFSSTRFTATLWDGIWATLFGANWRFAVLGTDYFQAGGPVSPLQHYWSLAVEEQFYFVWPWLMLLIFWIVSRRHVDSTAAARRVIGIAIVSLTVISFAWSVWETQSDASWAYFSTFSRAWELGVGAIIAVYASSFARINPVVRHILAWVGLTGIVAAVFITNQAVAFPGPAAAFPVVATALVILGGTGEGRSTLWPLTNPVSRYIGDISYSLYLWHFPVAVLLVSLFAEGSWEYYLTGILAMLALSTSSYYLVENPIRKSAWPDKQSRSTEGFGQREKLVGLGLLAAVTALTCAGALMPKAGPTETVALKPKATTSGVTLAQTSKDKCWGAASLDPKADCIRDMGIELLPPPKYAAEDIGNSYACFPQSGQPMKTCSYGGGKTRVALVGDSHAASLIPGLSEQASTQGWTLDTYVGVGCIWVQDSCSAIKDIQSKLLAGKYDIVITSAYRGSGDTDKEALSLAFANTWAPVASAGSKIIAVEDVPMGAGPAVACVQRVNFDLRNNDCKIDPETGYKVDDAAALAAQNLANAAVVKTERYYCTSNGCPAVIGNVVVYRDDISHISATYSKTLGPYLAKDIARAAAAL